METAQQEKDLKRIEIPKCQPITGQISNRHKKLFEFRVTHTKQTVARISNQCKVRSFSSRAQRGVKPIGQHDRSAFLHFPLSRHRLLFCLLCNTRLSDATRKGLAGRPGDFPRVNQKNRRPSGHSA